MKAARTAIQIHRGRCALAVGGLALALTGFSAGALAQAPASAQAEVDALIKAAKAEGEVTFYFSLVESTAKRVVDGFTAKYGIKAQFVRAPSTATVLRYSTEAAAGQFSADLLFVGGGLDFGRDGVSKGWLDGISQAGIPAVRSGEFPARFNLGPAATVTLTPWLIAYNSDKVKGADIPKDWKDLLNPKFNGQILIADPRSSDAYVPLWVALYDAYGESYFNQLRALNIRQYKSGIPAAQGMAAGEGSFTVPAIAATVLALKSKGAPVGMVTPDLTVGVETNIFMTARAKARHPNAGRLFAHYVMSPDGNKVFNAEDGAVSVFDNSGLPKQYKSPTLESLARKDLITKLLGFQ
jgi:iron(III) transport system substrate-binding protein